MQIRNDAILSDRWFNVGRHNHIVLIDSKLREKLKFYYAENFVVIAIKE